MAYELTLTDGRKVSVGVTRFPFRKNACIFIEENGVCEPLAYFRNIEDAQRFDDILGHLARGRFEGEEVKAGPPGLHPVPGKRPPARLVFPKFPDGFVGLRNDSNLEALDNRLVRQVTEKGHQLLQDDPDNAVVTIVVGNKDVMEVDFRKTPPAIKDLMK